VFLEGKTSMIVSMSELRTRRVLMDRVTDQAAIGRRVRAARRAAGLRQRDLAAICATTPNAVTNWEAGTRRLGISQAAMLLPILRVTLDWLYLGDDRGLDWEKREALAAALAEEPEPGAAPDLPMVPLVAA
jgi:transcriptional regulator with XRE-family HTH domain